MADRRPKTAGMTTPAVSPAYKQIEQWYEKLQSVSQAKPTQLLITSGAPDEDANQPKETDPTTQILDVFAEDEPHRHHLPAALGE
jgi:hypothetical protein